MRISRTRRRGRWTDWRHGDDGSATAEITLVAPFLIMLLVVVGIVIHRGVDTRIRIDDAAHQAARAASLEHTPDAANHVADEIATSALSGAGVVCRRHDVTTSTGDLQPGDTIHVTVMCEVDLGDALIPGLPASRRVSATASEPIDLWRSEALGFGITEATPVANRSEGVL